MVPRASLWEGDSEGDANASLQENRFQDRARATQRRAPTRPPPAWGIPHPGSDGWQELSSLTALGALEGQDRAAEHTRVAWGAPQPPRAPGGPPANMSYTGDYVLSVRTPSDDLLLPLRWLQRKEAGEGGGEKERGKKKKKRPGPARSLSISTSGHMTSTSLLRMGIDFHVSLRLQISTSRIRFKEAAAVENHVKLGYCGEPKVAQ